MNESTVMEPEVLTPKMDEKQKSDLEVKAQKFLDIAKSLPIRNNVEYQNADEYCSHALEHKKKIESFFKPIKQAIDKSKRVILNQEKGAVVPIDEGRNILKSKMLDYEREEKRKAKEREAKAAEEFRKKQAEQRKAEEKKREAQAEALADQGRDEEAVAVLDAPLQTDQSPAVPPVQPQAVPKIKTIIPQNWDFDAIDESLVPDEYKVIDEKKVRAVVKAMKDKTNIPGIRAFDKNAR